MNISGLIRSARVSSDSLRRRRRGNSWLPGALIFREVNTVGKLSSTFRSLALMLVLGLVPIRSAIAFEAGCDGLSVTWGTSVSDVQLSSLTNTNGTCNYYYSSEELRDGLIVSVNVSFPAPSGSSAWLLKDRARVVSCGLAWPSPPCDGQLSASFDVSAQSGRPYLTIELWANVRDLATGVQKQLSIYLTVSQSAEIEANPQLLGDQKDNKHTQFDGTACKRPVGLPDYSVNTSTLNLVVQDTDFAYSGLGPDIAFSRTWNADRSKLGRFGNGWSFSYESHIVWQCNGAVLKRGGGQGTFYAATLCPSSSLTYPVSTTAPQGNFDKLTFYDGDKEGGGYWLLEEKGTRLTYRYDLAPMQDSTIRYRLTSISDRNGNTLSVAYDLYGGISSITDAARRKTSFVLNETSGRRVASMTVPDGRTATYTYDAGGNMVGNTDLLGTAIAYTYDADGYMTSVNYAGKTVQFTYDTSGGWKHIATVIDANGNTTKYSASSIWNTQITDPSGGITSYANSSGRTSSITDAQGNTASQSFAGGLPVASTDASGKTSSMEYDAGGNLTKFTDTLGNVTTYSYDASGNITGATDALGKAARYEYDAKGNLLRSISPSGRANTYTYDAKGHMTSVKSANGSTSSFAYDAFGNVATATDARGKTTTMGYDPFGFNRLSVTDPSGRVTRFAYDNNGRLTKTSNPDGSFRVNGYDACSLTSLTDENGGVVAFERNGLLAVTRVTDALGKSTATDYDANGNAASTTDQAGRVTTMAYDKIGRSVRTTNPSGTYVEKTYDANGNLTLLRDESGRATLFSYDTGNRLLSVQDPLGGRVSYTRDALGRIVRITNARLASISTTYDDDGMLAGKTYSGGSGSATYVRDAFGNLSSVGDATGTTAYSYDSLNNVTGITYPDGLSLSLATDDAGRVSAITYPGGLIVSYGYDERSRVSSVSWGAGNSIAYTYDPAGTLTKVVRSNGTETSYTYDANDRITGIQHKKGTQVFAGLGYRRDAVGNIVEETATLPVSHRIAGESVSATHNDVNQIVKSSGDTYTYDADGNLTSIVGARTLSATYDPENRLVSVLRNGATITYAYNGLGMRTKAVSGGQTRNFHHNASGTLLFETDANGNVVAFYIYARSGLAAMVGTSGATYFYHFDKTGNTVALTDGDGKVAAAYAYEPFGKISNQTGSVVNPFTYVGALGVMDEGGGLYYMTNRYYDANTGRFLQKDPAGFPAGTNRYAYVGSNPVDAIDPLGLIGDDVGGGFDRWSRAARSIDVTMSDVHALDAPIDWMTNVSAGFGDALTTIPFTNWSLTRWARGDDDWAVDKKSWGYYGAGWAGWAAQKTLGTAASFNGGANSCFYSGEGMLAKAQQHGGARLLESTFGGRILNAINKPLSGLRTWWNSGEKTQGIPDFVWRAASGIYASNAKGAVPTYIAQNANPNGIWNTTEKLILWARGIQTVSK